MDVLLHTVNMTVLLEIGTDYKTYYLRLTNEFEFFTFCVQLVGYVLMFENCIRVALHLSSLFTFF